MNLRETLWSAIAMASLAALCECGGAGAGAGPGKDGGSSPDSGSSSDAGSRGDGEAGSGSGADASVDAPSDVAEAGNGAFDAAFYLGADITFTQEDEANGATYSDNGVAKPILQLLKDHGFNYVRLRTFVDPTQRAPNPQGGTFAPYSTQGFGDIAHTIAFGQRIKAAGMGLLLDFHYSDYWADPGKQIKPAAWANDDLAAAVAHLHDYTLGDVRALVAAGARPDMVQIGNEITPGILLTPGTSLGRPSPAGWSGLSQLLKAGIQAVHEVDPTIKIMLHIDKGGDVGGPDGGMAGEALANSIDFIDNALANGVVFECVRRVVLRNVPGSA